MGEIIRICTGMNGHILDLKSEVALKIIIYLQRLNLQPVVVTDP